MLGAMRRRSNGAWRTNVAQGGQAEPVGLTGEQERLAVEAAAAVGAAVAGVDLLPGPLEEWYVLEVNAVPGWRARAGHSNGHCKGPRAFPGPNVLHTVDTNPKRKRGLRGRPPVARVGGVRDPRERVEPPTPTRSASEGSGACLEPGPRSRFGLV